MSQYISIATPKDQNYKDNIAIEHILAFIGEKEKEKHKGIRVHSMSDFKAGLDYIDKKCGKKYKTAIRHLIYSKYKVTIFKSNYRNWKFHKTKAEQFFRVLYRELKKMHGPDEIWSLFDYLYSLICISFSVESKGSHIISYPYLSAMNQVRFGNEYDFDDRKRISRIENAIYPYDRLYRPRNET